MSTALQFLLGDRITIGVEGFGNLGYLEMASKPLGREDMCQSGTLGSLKHIEMEQRTRWSLGYDNLFEGCWERSFARLTMGAKPGLSVGRRNVRGSCTLGMPTYFEMGPTDGMPVECTNNLGRCHVGAPGRFGMGKT